MLTEKPSTYRMLVAIGENPGTDRKALAQILGIDYCSAGMSQPLQKLVEHGWIERERVPLHIVATRGIYRISAKGEQVLGLMRQMEALE